MKNLIVYYSMLGNTEYAAEKAAELLGADLLRIEPEKAYPDKGFKKFFWGGKSAVMGDKPALVPYEFDAGKYDRIIFATPVWAGTFTPPIRTFIIENAAEIKGKRFALITCYSGGGAEKAAEKLRAALGIDSFDAHLILVDPKDKPSEENNKAIAEFCEKLK
ncbi:MAG: flavodoxin family protein [Clostridia bacterium]|nr:flavodoxin family protein [Clostridia bacterium]